MSGELALPHLNPNLGCLLQSSLELASRYRGKHHVMLNLFPNIEQPAKRTTTLDGLIQALPDGLREFLNLEWFVKKVHTFLK